MYWGLSALSRQPGEWILLDSFDFNVDLCNRVVTFMLLNQVERPCHSMVLPNAWLKSSNTFWLTPNILSVLRKCNCCWTQVQKCSYKARYLYESNWAIFWLWLTVGEWSPTIVGSRTISFVFVVLMVFVATLVPVLNLSFFIQLYLT